MTTSKNRKRKRTIGKPGILDKAEMKRIHRLLST